MIVRTTRKFLNSRIIIRRKPENAKTNFTPKLESSKKSSKKTGQNKINKYTYSRKLLEKNYLGRTPEHTRNFYNSNYITMLDFNNIFVKEAQKELGTKIHKKEVIEILDGGRFYYEFLPICINIDKFDNTIIKLVELSDTEFNEDNKVYRFSLEELIEGRAFYLEKEEKKKAKLRKLFPKMY